MNIRNEVNLIKDQIINWRRYFHENPELSFKEFDTAKKIIEELEINAAKLNIDMTKESVTNIVNLSSFLANGSGAKGLRLGSRHIAPGQHNVLSGARR